MDSDFLNDDMVEDTPANLDLAYNSFKWLAGEQETIPIQLKRRENRGIPNPQRLDDQRAELLLLTVFMLPAASGILGLLVWYLRKT